MRKTIISLLVATTFLLSCSHYTPKPYAYFRIDLPKNEYVTFDSTYPPVNIQISKYAKVVPQQAKNNLEDYIDIVYPTLNGRIYCSYKEIKGDFRKLSEDSRNLVYKHSVRADAIIEKPFVNADSKVYGILYELTGNSASPIQFVLTDSVHHFMRGALYFNSVPNADSIAPVSAYVEKDLKHLVETITWKK
jgi:gliding motility-associated lipoprotein GldD